MTKSQTEIIKYKLINEFKDLPEFVSAETIRIDTVVDGDYSIYVKLSSAPNINLPYSIDGVSIVWAIC